MVASALYLLGTTVVLLLACCIIGFIGFTLYVYYQHRKYTHIPGPPLDSFYLGHVPTLMKLHRKGEYFGPTFTSWAEEYGPIFKVFTLHVAMLVPTSPALLKEIMTKGKYPKYKWAYRHIHSVFGERFCGDGVVTNLDHANWYKRRNAIQPAFHKKSLSQMMDKFNRVGNVWIDKLDSEVDSGNQICLMDYFNRAALASIVTVGFGLDIDAVNDPGHPFTQAIHDCMAAAAETSFNPAAAWDPGMRKYRRNSIAQAQLVRRYSKDCIETRFDEIAKGRQVPDDILTRIIHQAEKLDGITTLDLQDEFSTLFMAGQETTASSLAILSSFVGRRPDVLEKMREEVDEVLGDREDLTWDDVNKLEYVHCVFKETLRILPVAPASCRIIPHETVIDGIRLPAGSPIMIDIFTMHHISKYFEDPWDFKPERWLPDAPKPPLYTYLPFSMGPRSCAGQHFATIEAKVLIAKFLQKFTYDLDLTQDFQVKFNLTLKPKDGCKVTLHRRS